MSDLGVTLSSGLALGVTYGLLGAAVSVVWVATRTLHLAIGPIVVAGVLVRLFLDVDLVLGLPAVVPVAVGIAAAAGVSAVLEPLVLRSLREGVAWLVGLAVTGVVLETAVGRLLGARTYRPQPLIGGTGEVRIAGSTVAEPVVVAIAIGVPLVAVLAWSVHRSRWGRALRLVGGSPEAAALLGVSPRRTRAAALAVAGGTGALAGLLVAPVSTVGVTQGVSLTLRAVAAAALLGIAGPYRALAAGVVLGLVEAFAQQVAPALPGDVAVGLLVVLALTVAGDPSRRGWGRAW